MSSLTAKMDGLNPVHLGYQGRISDPAPPHFTESTPAYIHTNPRKRSCDFAQETDGTLLLKYFSQNFERLGLKVGRADLSYAPCQNQAGKIQRFKLVQ